MKSSTRTRYSQEFRHQAVQLMLTKGLSVAETARSLRISPKTLANWLKIYKKYTQIFGKDAISGKLGFKISKLPREDALSRRECDIFEKTVIILEK